MEQIVWVAGQLEVLTLKQQQIPSLLELAHRLVK